MYTHALLKEYSLAFLIVAFFSIACGYTSYYAAQVYNDPDHPYDETELLERLATGWGKIQPFLPSLILTLLPSSLYTSSLD